jgi:tetratricopeptide (TPR) repeat protein
VLKKGISLFEELGNTWNDPYNYYDLARAYLGVGDLSAAYDSAVKCLTSAQKGSDDFDAYEQAFGYEVLGRAFAELGDWHQAEASFKKAIKIMHDEGSFFEKARAQKFYGLALLKKGEFESGVRLLKTSLSGMKRLKMIYEANLISETLSTGEQKK